ncbi:MAG: radical SAM protein [Planctomycetes bacterium RBG_13_63_9]|nr:MAG: radical SAM protein [Planctomycetes bacterium RBG_13_63_9]
MDKRTASDSARTLFEAHGRSFEGNWYVYPVLSRRSGGISIGVNLSRDKGCNFRCIYCQVDRGGPGEKAPVDLGRLADELDHMLGLATSGQIYQQPKFRATPESLRRLNDVALSGDGEPTTCPQFDQVVTVCAEVRRRRGLDDLKLVLITNASLLHDPRVRGALEVLDANGGEIWAKLDAGTEAYYGQVARTDVPLRQILDNLADAARVRAIVIQSLFMRIRGEAPPPAEQEAYTERLREIVAGGGRIRLVQIHTIARTPTESWVAPLADAEVDAMAELVRRRTDLPVAAFYGGA